MNANLNILRIATLLVGTVAITTSGCVSEPWEGQHIGRLDSPFRACGYLPSRNNNITLQRYNFTTQLWETIGRGAYDGTTRYVSGYPAYGWRNDSVQITRTDELWLAPNYWRPVSFGQRFARFRAIDLSTGTVFPQQDKNTMEIVGTADYVTVYASLW